MSSKPQSPQDHRPLPAPSAKPAAPAKAASSKATPVKQAAAKAVANKTKKAASPAVKKAAAKPAAKATAKKASPVKKATTKAAASKSPAKKGTFDKDKDQPEKGADAAAAKISPCLLYTSPSPRDGLLSRMPSSA
mgnify:CR=1 FL=1